jgi:hypothetical protein
MLAFAISLLAACGGSESSNPPPATGIGPAGGTVTGPAGARVVVPPNALAANVDIAIAQSSVGAPALPANRVAVGPVFAFTPHGTTFAQPATVTVPFDAALLGSGTAELWKTNAAQTGWEAVAGAMLGSGTMSAPASAFSWYAVVTPVIAPTITTAPANQTVTAGASATFSVAASGTAPLAYQWRRNNVDIAGATTASHTTPPTTLADSGAVYTVVVSNAAGSVTSTAATLTVNAAAVPPSIVTQPVAQSVNAGQTATFSVTANGTAPLAYQWRKNGVDVAGATAASHTTPATTLDDNGALYSVVVSNSVGTATSNAVALTVNAPPSGAVGTPTALDNSAADTRFAQTVIDSQGRATTVWWRLVSGDVSFGEHVIEARSSNAAGTIWGATAGVSSAVAARRSAPALAIAGNDHVFAAWHETHGSAAATGLYAARLDPASGVWSAPVRIGDGGVGGQTSDTPALAADANGNAILLWAGAFVGDPSSPFVRTTAARFTPGSGSWSAPEVIETYPTTDAQDSGAHKVAMDAAGNAVGVWARQNAIAYTAVASRFSAATSTWGGVQTVDARNGVFQPRTLAVDGSGNALLLTSNRVLRRDGSAGTWAVLSAGLPTINGNQVLAAAPDLSAVLLNSAVVGSTFTLTAYRYDPTALTWSGPVNVATGGLTAAVLAVSANGEAVAHWAATIAGSSDRALFTSRYASGAWGAAQRASNATAGVVQPQAAAMNASGRAAVSWTEVPSGASHRDIWSNVLP